MQDSGPQKVRQAIAQVEQQATILLQQGRALQDDSAAWQSQDLLKQAREYARAVNALTRVRKRQ